MAQQTEAISMQARQWSVLVCHKDEPGARFGRQYMAATNAYEAIQMAKALYGKPLSLAVRTSLEFSLE